jgi:hypothetical protein
MIFLEVDDGGVGIRGGKDDPRGMEESMGRFYSRLGAGRP